MKLEVNNINKSFGEHGALHQIHLYLEAFQTLVLIGPSGGGKSTLLRLIGGLEKPDEGLIKLDDRRVPDREPELLEHRKSVGIVFQSWNLFPHLTSIENISLPLYRVHGYSKQEADECAMTLLKRFELEKHAHRKPGELSGGQCQRVAIVRAVAIKPKILLFDEPTSALDPLMAAEVLELINELKESGSHFIMASHHIGFVKKIADYVAFIAEGKLIEYNAAQEFFLDPRSEYIQFFLDKAMKY